MTSEDLSGDFQNRGYSPNCQAPEVKVWGANSFDSSLVVFHQTFIAQRYVNEILCPKVLPFRFPTRGLTYQQDGALLQTVRLSIACLRASPKFSWPARL